MSVWKCGTAMVPEPLRRSGSMVWMERKTLLMAAFATLFFVVLPTTAYARRTADSRERAAVTRATGTGYPARCSDVYISTLNSTWASWETSSRLPSGCPSPNGNGVIVLHVEHRRWRIDTEASSGACASGRPLRGQPHISRRMARDLRC